MKSIRILTEEGHYTIKRVHKLPKVGNANWLYTYVEPSIKAFYKWNAFKKEYETITIGATNYSDLIDIPEFGLVATTNDYNDLTNIPSVITSTSGLINNGEDEVNPFAIVGETSLQDVIDVNKVADRVEFFYEFFHQGEFLASNSYYIDYAAGVDGFYVYGSFLSYDGVPAKHVVKIQNDGYIDASFMPIQTSNNTVYSTLSILEEIPSGKLLMGGAFTNMNGVTANNIVRFNTDGSVDESFDTGSGFNSFTTGLTYNIDNTKIYATGFFSTYRGAQAVRIARLNLDGTHDVAFAGGQEANTGIGLLAADDGGVFYTSYNGTYKGFSSPGIVKILPNGNRDPSFNVGTGIVPTGSNRVHQMTKAADGKIYLYSNGMTSYNGTPVGRFVKLNLDGSIDTTFQSGIGFGSNGSLYVSRIDLDQNGRLLVVGVFTRYNGVSEFNGTTINGTIILNTDGTIYAVPASIANSSLGQRMDFLNQLSNGDYVGFIGGKFNLLNAEFEGHSSNRLTFSEITGKAEYKTGGLEQITAEELMPRRLIEQLVKVGSVTKTSELINDGSDGIYPFASDFDVSKKANIESPAFTGTVGGITKAMVGLSNVDNTSDINKPISSATQATFDAVNIELSSKISGSGFNTYLPKFNSSSSLTSSLIREPGDGSVDIGARLSVNGTLGVNGNGTFNGFLISSPAISPNQVVIKSQLDLKANIASPTFTGTVSGIDKTMVGLSNVPNTDFTVAVSANTAKISFDNTSSTRLSNTSGTNTGDQDLSGYQLKSEKDASSGYVGLDGSGKINPLQLPAIAITETFVVNSQAAMLATTSQTGDVAVRTDVNKTFILTADAPATLANWQELLSPLSEVTSVFGRTGAVTAQNGDYTKAQVGLSNVQNTDLTSAVNANNAKISFDNTSSTRLANTSGTNTGDQTLSSLGAAPASGSANYIQNGTSQQAANLNISGNGLFGSSVAATNLNSTDASNFATNSGNVGIGTTTPTNFTGYKTLSIDGVSGGVLQLKANNINGLALFTEPTRSYLFEGRNLPLKFFTNGTERLELAASGAATFSSSVTATDGIFSGNAFLSTSNSYLRGKNANNTAYKAIIGIGGSTSIAPDKILIDPDNTGIYFGGAATFASSVTANGNSVINGGSGAAVLVLNKSLGAQISLSGATGTTNYVTFEGSNNTNPNLSIYVGGSIRQIIEASTGAATFSSSVTATSHVTTGGTASQFVKGDGSLSNSTYSPLAFITYGGFAGQQRPLLPSEAGSTILCTGTSSNSIVLNSDYVVGGYVDVIKDRVSGISFLAGSGVTIKSKNASPFSVITNGIVRATYISNGNWLLTGDLI